MEIALEPGKYIVAVSGGVDSVALLDLLCTNYQLLTTNYQFIVAHFDHSIRPDSELDRIFVQNLAKKYNLDFEHKRENLGPNASEELARDRRYKFLNQVLAQHKARAVITAHHGDDLLETAIFNLLRGSGRRGLSSLKTRQTIIRPLLSYKKSDILRYAKNNNLQWREDPTNSSDKYARNRIRQALTNLETSQKKLLTETLNDSAKLNQLIDGQLEDLFSMFYDTQKHCLSRQLFIKLPHVLAKEIIILWLKKIGANYDKKLVEKLTKDLKTAKHGKNIDIDKNYYFELNAKDISLKSRTTV